jgi:hypothetical protein
VPSGNFGFTPWWDRGEQFFLSPEDLPLFKKELELKMKVLQLADDTTALARERVQTTLTDIARIEKKLDEGSD